MKKTAITKTMKTFALETLAKFIIIPLMDWASKDTDAFFFIIIGNDKQTDVAYANTEKLACEGALGILGDPHTAGAFSTIETTFDIALDDSLKDEGFRKVYEVTLTDKDDRYWSSTSDMEFDMEN